jgi:hypothetical protein
MSKAHRFLLCTAIITGTVWAERPRDQRWEVLTPRPSSPSPQAPATILFAAVGGTVWSSSLTVVSGVAGAIGLGRWLTPNLFLMGQFDLAAITSPPQSAGGINLLLTLSANLGWNVLSRKLPVEVGPEIGVGGSVMLASGFSAALPMLLPGVFARYVFRDGLAVGVRGQVELPFWTAAPRNLVGNAYISPSPLDPYGFNVALCLLHTF